jgi:membrane protein required for colicin V production
MSIFDIILIVLISASAIYGITKGFIRDVFSLIAVIVGVVVAFIGYPWAAGYLAKIIPAGPPANIAGFAVILLSVSIAVSVLGVVIAKAIAGADLSVYDRVAGACFGLFEGIVVACFITVLAATLIPSATSSSRIAPHLLRVVNAAVSLLPADSQEKIDAAKGTLKKMRDEAVTTPKAQEGP